MSTDISYMYDIGDMLTGDFRLLDIKNNPEKLRHKPFVFVVTCLVKNVTTGLYA